MNNCALIAGLPFPQLIITAAALSVEMTNAHHRADFGEDAIRAPWDPRELAARNVRDRSVGDGGDFRGD